MWAQLLCREQRHTMLWTHPGQKANQINFITWHPTCLKCRKVTPYLQPWLHVTFAIHLKTSACSTIHSECKHAYKKDVGITDAHALNLFTRIGVTFLLTLPHTHTEIHFSFSNILMGTHICSVPQGLWSKSVSGVCVSDGDRIDRTDRWSEGEEDENRKWISEVQACTLPSGYCVRVCACRCLRFPLSIYSDNWRWQVLTWWDSIVEKIIV